MSKEVKTIRAKTEYGQLVHISEVERRTPSNRDLTKYYCPICGAEMIPRKGDKNEHHFRHKGQCTETWIHDKSEWHKEWQNKFPDECQEIPMENNGKKHIADVLYKGIVFEFQHSPISKEEFEDRNTFYNSLGHPVVWLFDVLGKRKNETISEQLGGLYWENPFETFIDYKCERKPVLIFFEFPLDNDWQIRKLKTLSKPYDSLEFEENSAIFEGEGYRDDFISSFDSIIDAKYITDPKWETLYDIVERIDSGTYAFITLNTITNRIYIVEDARNQLQNYRCLIGTQLVRNVQGLMMGQTEIISRANYPHWIVFEQYDKEEFEVRIGLRRPVSPVTMRIPKYTPRGPLERYLPKSNNYKQSK